MVCELYLNKTVQKNNKRFFLRGSLWERTGAGEGRALSLGLGVVVTVGESQLEPESSHWIQLCLPPLLNTRGPWVQILRIRERPGRCKEPEVGRQESAGCWEQQAASRGDSWMVAFVLIFEGMSTGPGEHIPGSTTAWTLWGGGYFPPFPDKKMRLREMKSRARICSQSSAVGKLNRNTKKSERRLSKKTKK